MYTPNEIRTWESVGKTSQPSDSPRFLENSKLNKMKKEGNISNINTKNYYYLKDYNYGTICTLGQSTKILLNGLHVSLKKGLLTAL
jgi:hypothetical protein